MSDDIKDPSAAAEETRWTDDRIRWMENDDDYNHHDNEESSNNDKDDEGYGNDLFKPDPHDVFSFHFSHGNSSIDIELRGFKAESDEIYKSTGLTLWRASKHLCHYMLQHADELLTDNKRILEVKRVRKQKRSFLLREPDVSSWSVYNY